MIFGGSQCNYQGVKTISPEDGNSIISGSKYDHQGIKICLSGAQDVIIRGSRSHLREFVNYRHPNPRRVWKGGSGLRSLPPFPLDPAHWSSLAKIGPRIPKSLIFVTPVVIMTSDPPPLSSPGLLGTSSGPWSLVPGLWSRSLVPVPGPQSLALVPGPGP